MAGLVSSSSRGLADPAATVAGLLIALVAFNVFAFWWNRSHPSSEQDPKDVAAALVPMAITWAITLAVLAVVLFWEREGLTSIGLTRPKLSHVAWGLAGFAVGGAVFLLSKPLVEAMGLVDVQARAEKLNAFPLWIAVPGILTNGFTEEILFRGYVLERLGSVTGNLLAAGMVAWFAFVIGHYLGWGLGSTIQIGVWAIVITLLYVTQRSLWPCIVMHVVNNFTGLVILPRITPKGLDRALRRSG